MEYYNEFKLTMETNAKAKEASEILINRLNKGFEIDNNLKKVECVEVKCLKSLGFGAYRGSFNPIILWISTYINVLLYFDFIVDFS